MAQDEVAERLRRWTANPLCSARVGSNPILVGQCLWMWAAIIPNDWRSYMFGHINGQLFCYSIQTKCRKTLSGFLSARPELDEVAEWLRWWTANPLCFARVGSNPIHVGQCLWMWAAIISNDWRSYMFGHINGQLFCYSIKTKCRKNDTVRLLVSQARTRRGGRVVKVMDC